MVEVSVGVYVFLITVPALIYSTFIPQELREMRNKSAFRQIKPFSVAFGYVLLIVLLATAHFFISEVCPGIITDCDRWCCCHEPFQSFTYRSRFFSEAVTAIASLLFLLMLLSVSRSSRRMKQGYLKLISENLKNALIEHFNQFNTVKRRMENPWVTPFYTLMRTRWFKTMQFTQTKEADLWREVDMLGKYTSPGSQKQTWLLCMEGIIMHLVNDRRNPESLKTGIKMLGDVMGDASHTATYENVKDTLNIYRALLNKLNTNAQKEDAYQLTECYSAISRSLRDFANTAVKEENLPLLFNITSTITLMPNHTSDLFEVAVMALKHRKYEILAHSFNEIIGRGEVDEERQHNFWGIYAALYLKDGAFQQHAEQMRKNSGFPPLNNRDLRAAYHYHFSNAHFDVADFLYQLMDRRSKKDPAESG